MPRIFSDNFFSAAYMMVRTALAFFCSPFCAAHPGHDARDPVVQEMEEAARTWLAALSEDQKKKALHPFDEERKDWHYFPKDRNGLSLKEMDEAQKEAASGLLAASLSVEGVETVQDVISLEEVLRELEGRGPSSIRDPERYHLWIFGTPGEGNWGWRFEGHHVSLNTTVIPGEGVSVTPTFLGANPAEVPSGPRKGFRALPEEEDLALQLAQSLDEEQRERAVFDTDAPRDIFTFVERQVSPLPVKGIPYGELDPNQQKLLRQLVQVYLERNRPEIAKDRLGDIQSRGWSNVVFGWAGGVTRDDENYYFIQGPSFLIEYDNTQNENNHIHSVWREFDGDFGEDLIRRHREEHTH